MRAAFDAVVDRHGATVLRVCRAVLGPGADADDAWSETFLSALRAWPELPEDTDVEAWLVRVAHRRAVDVVRRASRTAVPTGVADDVAVLEARASGAGGARGAPGVDDDEDGSWIWDAVAALPTRQRLCVAYRYLGGLRYAEIAELTGGTEAAARRAAADGIAALRRTLTPPPTQAPTQAQSQEVAP
ncbi:sigma-70 family RNA polymerase sigma factor [Dietzia sp. CH92]|uniref:RNA polymerase sigma factor n=1 Tax=Dietzia sp. CH92 TaxID=3051823 RepID=UPI0028D45FE3|nr:sigma-70 family RNA polymerase sigma factor [Dietzia sp. CH92]